MVTMLTKVPIKIGDKVYPPGTEVTVRDTIMNAVKMAHFDDGREVSLHVHTELGVNLDFKALKEEMEPKD
jgi:hypothetical protein